MSTAELSPPNLSEPGAGSGGHSAGAGSRAEAHENPVPFSLVVALSLLSPFAPIAMDVYLPALPQAARDLHASDAATQLTLSACMIGLAIGQLVIGTLSDRFGRLVPLRLGMAGFVLASIGCALSVNLGLLIGLRFVQGFCGAAGIVIARAIVRDVATGSAAVRLMVLMGLISGVAPIFAPLLGGALLSFTTWRGSFVAIALLGLVIAASTAPILGETLPRTDRRGAGLSAVRAGFAAVAQDGTFRRHALALAGSAAALFAYVNLSSLVFQVHYGLSPQRYSLVFASNAVGIVLVGRAGALQAGRFGARRMLIVGASIGTLAGTILVISIAGGAGLFVAWPLLWIAMSCAGLIGPIAQALALTHQGAQAGTASATLGLVTFASGAVVAPLASIGGVTPMRMAVAVALGMAVCLGALLAPRR